MLLRLDADVCRFNTQPPEGGWRLKSPSRTGRPKFQHTAARRRLATISRACAPKVWFQHTAARRRLGPLFSRLFDRFGFNTQPPEGGWKPNQKAPCAGLRFNTQPPEGGWLTSDGAGGVYEFVSTHSRPKAAGLGQGVGF